MLDSRRRDDVRAGGRDRRSDVAGVTLPCYPAQSLRVVPVDGIGGADSLDRILSIWCYRTRPRSSPPGPRGTQREAYPPTVVHRLWWSTSWLSCLRAGSRQPVQALVIELERCVDSVGRVVDVHDVQTVVVPCGPGRYVSGTSVCVHDALHNFHQI
jgi:hypothetical protein